MDFTQRVHRKFLGDNIVCLVICGHHQMRIVCAHRVHAVVNMSTNTRHAYCHTTYTFAIAHQKPALNQLCQSYSLLFLLLMGYAQWSPNAIYAFHQDDPRSVSRIADRSKVTHPLLMQRILTALLSSS